ncbi:MAG TPA: hypothetical protein VLB80_00190 [Candidatus Babeliales bacterium]|nr:hypothetical protein [Candidatus Babeliales bacterium]
MKFFKGMLAIVALFAIESVSARSRLSDTTPYTPTPSAPERDMPKPQAKSYAALVNEIKNEKSENVWDANKKIIKNTFADKIGEAALAVPMAISQLDALLIIAKDYHVPFTNDQNENINILNKLAQQRSDIENWFKIGIEKNR